VPFVGKYVVSVDLPTGSESGGRLIELPTKRRPAPHHLAHRLGTHHAEGPDLPGGRESDDPEIGEVGYVLRVVEDRH
jgi:hypothetical protein